MERRTFVQGAAASALATVLGTAQAATPVHIVKFLLFSCPLCRGAEGFDPALSSAAQSTGGRLVHAPLPMDGDYAAQFYYAARDVSRTLEQRVRLSLYKAVQDMGIPMNDAFRVLVWLQQDLGDMESVDWRDLMARTTGTPVSEALARSANLASSMGVTNTPSYVLVQNNRPTALFDPTSVTPANSMSALRDTVINKTKELSAK